MLQAFTLLPQKMVGGWLQDNTFGSSDANIKTFLAANVLHTARVHLINCTCVNNNLCWAGDFLNGYSLSRLQQESQYLNSRYLQGVCSKAKEVEAYALTYPQIKFYVNGCLEHQLNSVGAMNTIREIRACAPHVTAIDNPRGNTVSPYPPLSGIITEKHGASIASIVSLDGTTVEDLNRVVEWIGDNGTAVMTMIWSITYNGRLAKTFQRPDLRTEFPNLDQFSWFIRLMWPLEPKPTTRIAACSSFSDVPSDQIYKTASENYGPSTNGARSSRDGKPVTIFNVSGDVQAYTTNNLRIAYFKYYGGFGAKPYRQWRAYSGSGSGFSAWGLWQAAYKASGNGWIFLKKSDGKCFLVYSLIRSGVDRP